MALVQRDWQFDHAIHLCARSVHVGLQFRSSDSNDGVDSEKVCVAHCVDCFFQQSVDDFSLDWNRFGVWRRNRLHRHFQTKERLKDNCFHKTLKHCRHLSVKEFCLILLS